MAGFRDCEMPRVRVMLSHDIEVDPRPEFQRAVAARMADYDGTVEPNESVEFFATVTGQQHSSRIASVCLANVLLVLPAKTANVGLLKAGEVVDALLLASI